MLARIRLMQMTSQAFPIGGFSHSYGLEAAVESGLLRDEKSVQEWVADVLAYSIFTYEAPALHDMSEAWSAPDLNSVRHLNAEFLAARESAELRSATVQLGFSMRKLLAALPGLPEPLLDALHNMDEPSLPCVWSATAHAWGIAKSESMAAYLWSWAENQVLAAMKSVPIGQSSAQRVLLHAGENIARFIARGLPRLDEESSNFAPGLAILCCQHETQYSRLFRS